MASASRAPPGRRSPGRWQYRYSAAAVRQREQKKYDELIAFGAALPKLRAFIDRDLRLPGLPREKVMACILRLLSTGRRRRCWNCSPPAAPPRASP